MTKLRSRRELSVLLLLLVLTASVIPLTESLINTPYLCDHGTPCISPSLPTFTESNPYSSAKLVSCHGRSLVERRSTSTDEVYYSSSPFVSTSSSYGGPLLTSPTVAGVQQKVTLTRFLSHVVQEHPEVRDEGGSLVA